MLCAQDEFYNRYLVRNNLFEPVIEVFLANGARYNLLNSAVLELVDFVRKVRHLTNRHTLRCAEATVAAFVLVHIAIWLRHGRSESIWSSLPVSMPALSCTLIGAAASYRRQLCTLAEACVFLRRRTSSRW